jgi:hypothetical protein
VQHLACLVEGADALVVDLDEHHAGGVQARVVGGGIDIRDDEAGDAAQHSWSRRRSSSSDAGTGKFTVTMEWKKSIDLVNFS